MFEPATLLPLPFSDHPCVTWLNALTDGPGRFEGGKLSLELVCVPPDSDLIDSISFISRETESRLRVFVLH